MREIKFRVWNPKTKEFFIQLDGSRTDLALEYYKKTPKVSFPEQFTGMTDKDGNDIYEGDTVYIDAGYRGGANCEVKFMDGAFVLVSTSKATEGQVFFGLNIRLEGWKVELTGHIHQ